MLLQLLTLAVLNAEEFRSFRVGSTYGWGFQRPHEKTATFFRVIPVAAVFTYDDNALLPTSPVFTKGFQVGYAMNMFRLQDTDGTVIYTDVTYLVFATRLGLHYTVLNLVTLQLGAMPYLVAGFGVGKPDTYKADDWPERVLKPGFSGYITFSAYPLGGRGEFQNLGFYLEFAPGLAQLSAGFTARTDFAGQYSAPEGPYLTKDQRLMKHVVEELIPICDFDGYKAATRQNPLTQEQVNEAILLHRAASYGCIPILQDLIKQGFDVEQTNAYGETPIFTAIRAREIESVRVLVKAKADLSHTNPFNQTPLDVAEEQDFAAAVRILRSAARRR
ncbi:MAG: ankyrin repeat domain-containing protein [Leptospiraceae bacterium]|nr:ankyrin repeat domain-containing protein [Leptospiraceae bacterium]